MPQCKNHIRPSSLIALCLGWSVFAPSFAHAQSAAPESETASPQQEMAAEEVSAASAEPTNCADAYEQAQTEKINLKYKRARELAQLCSRLECNVPAITGECVKLDEQLEREIPTLVFSARKWDGAVLIDVTVEMDGQPLLNQLDGTPVTLDPGTYEFRFQAPGFDPITATHVARVGDTNRLIELVFGEAPPEASAASAPATTGPIAAQEPPRSIPTASYILGGVGVLALGAFGYLRISGIQQYNELNTECSPNCDQGEVDELRAKFRLSWLPLGVGVAALGGAVAVYYFGNTSSSEPAAELGLAPIQGGAGAQLRGRF